MFTLIILTILAAKINPGSAMAVLVKVFVKYLAISVLLVCQVYRLYMHTHFY